MTVHDDGTLSNDRIKELEDAVNALDPSAISLLLGPTVVVTGAPAQTDPLLDLQDSNAVSFFRVGPDAGSGVVLVNADGSFSTTSIAGANQSYIESDGAGFYTQVGVDSTDGAFLIVKGKSGQTADLLTLRASDNAYVIEATGDKKIGVFNHAAAAQQTGVAVTAAAIHAALVAYGWITA